MLVCNNSNIYSRIFARANGSHEFNLIAFRLSHQRNSNPCDSPEENMLATLWLLTLTLVTAGEYVYAATPLVEYRRSEVSTPLGIQDDYVLGEERPKRMTFSINDSIQKLRDAIILRNLREKARLRNEQIKNNQVQFDRVGKRGNERKIEREYYEPYQHHLDLGTLIRRLADANYQSYNVLADTVFDDNNDIEMNSGIPLQNMHLNIDDDAQNDQFIDSNDERAWLHQKQQRHFNQLQKQQQLNEQNKNFLRQWDNKQLNDRIQVPSPQAQQQQQENQQQKQRRQTDISHQPVKSFDNDERFMLQTFDTQ